jgi:hypothetical protein
MPNGTLHTYLESRHNDLTVLDRSRLVSRTFALILSPFHQDSIKILEARGCQRWPALL